MTHIHFTNHHSSYHKTTIQQVPPTYVPAIPTPKNALPSKVIKTHSPTSRRDRHVIKPQRALNIRGVAKNCIVCRRARQWQGELVYASGPLSPRAGV